jgi:putative ABC transport system ATP-binding protein
VMELFHRLHTGGQTIILVTHADDVAAKAQRLVRMRDGRVIERGLSATDAAVSSTAAN